MRKKTNNSELSLPWFKFWGTRWLGSESVNGMTLAEQGVFVRLLCAQHIYRTLPRDSWQLSKLLGIRYEAATRWLQKHSSLTADADGRSSQFVVPKMTKLQLTLKKSTADRVGDETREDESTPYSPPKGGEKAGREECPRCLGEGRVPQFQNHGGVTMPVGYGPCVCM